MGIVSNKMLAKAGIKQPVFFAELEWADLVRMAVKVITEFTPLPKTQPVHRDLALLVDSSVTFDAIAAVVRQTERKLLRDVGLFDVYEGKNLPEGKKSYAISITLQDVEKTLQDAVIEKTMNRIIDQLRRNVGAELR